MALHYLDPLWDGERIERAVASNTNMAFNLWSSPETEPTTVSDWVPDYSAWLTAKTEDEISDDYDKWRGEQIKKGLIPGD